MKYTINITNQDQEDFVTTTAKAMELSKSFTDIDKQTILSISKKVYTKMRECNNFPNDVLQEVSGWIRERNYPYLAAFTCKESLKNIFQICNQ